ncbi:hypothetical protein BGZ65_001078, partial [Modicella reniformis]
MDGRPRRPPPPPEDLSPALYDFESPPSPLGPHQQPPRFSHQPPTRISQQSSTVYSPHDAYRQPSPHDAYRQPSPEMIESHYSRP